MKKTKKLNAQDAHLRTEAAAREYLRKSEG